METNRITRWGTAACIIGSIIGTAFFSNPGRRRGAKLFNEQQRELDQNLLSPANGTFPVVWSVVYGGTVGLAIHQALPTQQANPRYQKARPWWLVSYALNALFGYFFARPDRVSRVGAGLTTIAMLPTAIGLHRSLDLDQPADVPQPERSLRRAVSLYAGWLTAASVVSAGNLFIQAGLRPAGLRPAGLRVSRRQDERWAYALLPVTAALGITVARRLNDPYYLAPFVAAFSGIAVKQWAKSNGVATLAGACAVVVAVAALRQAQAPARSSVQPPRPVDLVASGPTLRSPTQEVVEVEAQIS